MWSHMQAQQPFDLVMLPDIHLIAVAQGDLSLGDPAVSAPQRISSSPAAGASLQSNQVTQDVQVRTQPTMHHDTHHDPPVNLW